MKRRPTSRGLVAAATLLAVAAGLSVAPATAADAVTKGSSRTTPIPMAHGSSHTAARTGSSQWPVRTRTSTLARATNTTPSGDASQQFTAVSMSQDLKYGSLAADIHLGAAPTTDSRLRFGFGTTSSAGCQPDASAYEDIDSMDVDSTGTSGNPSYDGAHIVVKPFAFAPAKNKSWGCFYTEMFAADADPASATPTDVWVGSFTDHIQKPELTIKVANRKLTPRRFTRVPVTILNSKDTIATAKGTTLTWRTRGVVVRGNHNVGSIAPGTGKHGVLLVKGSRSGAGSIVLTARSGDYHHSVRLTVRPVH